MASYERPPKYTDRILQETGMGCAIGGLSSIPFHFFKGAGTMPRGSRIIGGVDYVRLHAPRTAGSFAAWVSLFTAADRAAAHFRRKEDLWNPITAGVSAKVVFTLRQVSGPINFMMDIVSTGLLMALAEGFLMNYERRRLSKKLDIANKVAVEYVPVTVQEEAGSLSRFFRTSLVVGKRNKGLIKDLRKKGLRT